jgi:hypothetical protein
VEEIKEIQPEDLENKKSSDKTFIIALGVIIILIAVIIGFKLLRTQTPKTIEDLHKLNLQGKLKPGEGYVYNGYSFVYFDGLWYSQVQKGNTLFDFSLHYAPKDLSDVPLEGDINSTPFDSSPIIYYTFDPLGTNLNYVTLAAGEFSRSMIAAFNKQPKAACDKNETTACKTVPILTCENTDLPLVYFRDESPTRVIYDNNCIIVQGQGPELVRASNRMLLNLYGIMP